MAIKSIHKCLTGLKFPEGYARLTAGTLVLTVVTFAVVVYQVYAGFSLTRSPQPDRKQFAQATSVQIFPQTLPVLDDLQYLIELTDEEGETLSVGSFAYRSADTLTDERGQVIANGILQLPEPIEKIQSVTLSLYDDSNPRRPIVIPFLAGPLRGDRAHLSFAGPDFSDAQASMMLATPTDNNSLVNERSGLWFGNVLSNQPLVTLPLPPQGWIYEGWAVIDGRTVTTGRFRQAEGGDDFNGFSDTKAAAPNIPGEDFLRNAPVQVFPDLRFPVDLTGQIAMITLEPDMADDDPTGAGQFPAPILRRSIPRLAEAGKLYELEQTLDELPKSTVVIR